MKKELMLKVKFEYDYTGLGIDMLSYHYNLTIGEVIECVNYQREPPIEFDLEAILRQQTQL